MRQKLFLNNFSADKIDYVDEICQKNDRGFRTFLSANYVPFLLTLDILVQLISNRSQSTIFTDQNTGYSDHEQKVHYF